MLFPLRTGGEGQCPTRSNFAGETLKLVNEMLDDVDRFGSNIPIRVRAFVKLTESEFCLQCPIVVMQFM